jgi:hypothetical protein
VIAAILAAVAGAFIFAAGAMFGGAREQRLRTQVSEEEVRRRADARALELAMTMARADAERMYQQMPAGLESDAYREGFCDCWSAVLEYAKPDIIDRAELVLPENTSELPYLVAVEDA